MREPDRAGHRTARTATLLLAATLLAALPSACGDGAAPADTGANDGGIDAMRADTGARPACPDPVAPIAARAGEPPNGPLDGLLRVNHLQVKGTHNSYHVETSGNEIPDWQYTHVPLDEQFESQGVRAVELDVYWDVRCERYEVFHIGLLDETTTCRLFTDCLTTMRRWSDANPGHLPLFVQIEVKNLHDDPRDAPLAALDSEIRAIWPDSQRISPDDIRGERETLRDGVVMDGWPTLGEARGKALFFLNDGGEVRDAYSANRTSLAGRTMFAEAGPGDPIESVLVLNSPIDDAMRIRDAVAAGFIVRTRADSGGAEARANDRTTLRAALESGGHIVSTDFPAPVPGLDYFVEIPSGTPARCNPISAPEECDEAALSAAP